MDEIYYRLLSIIQQGQLPSNDEIEKAKACAAISKEGAIEFAEWISKNDFKYVFRSWHNSTKTEWYTSAKLFDLFTKRKEEGKQ